METPIQDLDNKQYHNIETPQWNVAGCDSSNKKCTTMLNILKEHNSENDNMFSQNYFKVNEIKIDLCKNNDISAEKNKNHVINSKRKTNRKLEENKENIIINIRGNFNNTNLSSNNNSSYGTSKMSNTYSNFTDTTKATKNNNSLQNKDNNKVKVNASVKKVFEKSKTENTQKSAKKRYNSKEPVEKLKESNVSSFNKRNLKNSSVSKECKKTETLQPRISFRNTSKDTNCLRNSTKSANKVQRVSTLNKNTRLLDKKLTANKTPEPKKDPKRLTISKNEPKNLPPTTTIHYDSKSKYIGTTLKNGHFNEKHGVGVMFYADGTK